MNAVVPVASPSVLSGRISNPSGEVDMGSGDGTTVLWRPTGPTELDEFNAHLVGLIEVVHEFLPTFGSEQQ
ncbi:hypothetical protein [Micromonospora sp. DT233]|uniref:hypothetical protein n=1 Tax=Micromonospora sp. DT233 TaxID=3393432 RepID=UPI003CEE8929